MRLHLYSVSIARLLPSTSLFAQFQKALVRKALVQKVLVQKALTQLTLCLLALSPLLCVETASALDKNIEVYKFQQTVSDGKDGRVWRQWRQEIQNRRVKRVEAVVRRTAGAQDTFINLRFGMGQSFEGGRQSFLRDENEQTVVWQVNASPKGQPLVLNAYQGEVRLEKVIVHYQQTGVSAGSAGSLTPKPNKPGWRNAVIEKSDNTVPGRCRRAKRVQVPKIEVGEVKARGGLFSGKYKISGSLFGACIEEAGYFENGKLKQQFDFPLSDTVKRAEFSVDARTGKNGEIRLFSTTGQESIEFVDEIIAKKKSAYR